jgi:hypothetical protein
MPAHSAVASPEQKDTSPLHGAIPPLPSGTRNCAWMRTPWGEADTQRREMRGERYRRAIGRLLKDELLYANPNPAEGCLNIKIRGGMIQDFGNFLVMENGTEREIAAMVKLFGLKQWQSVELTGTHRFREQAMLESVRGGVQVLGGAMPEHLKARLAEAKPPARAVEAAVPAAKKKPARLGVRPIAAADSDNEARMMESVEQYLLDMLAE